MTIDEGTGRTRILERVRMQLQAERLDAYLAYTPANNRYCSGFVSWFVGEHWRFHGGQLTLIPADLDVAPALILPEAEAPLARQATRIDDVRGYGMWIETRELDVITAPPPPGKAPLQRTSWWEPEEQDSILRDVLGERGLLDGRIGTDLSFAMLDSAERFRRLAPRARWVDWTAAIFGLRAVKQPFEIDCLARAVELQEAAFEVVRESLEAGMTASDIRKTYSRAILDAADANHRYPDFADSWILVSVGSDDGIGGEGTGRQLAKGELVNLDGGVTVGGYKSDGGRTFAFGRPPDTARRLHETLLAANDLACAELVPGRPIARAFEAAEKYMHTNGYPQYCRGQYGHSIGLEQFPEEPPYISRDETRSVEAGMVLAVETPYYGADIGAMTIEDMILVTDDGAEPMHHAPRGLVVVDRNCGPDHPG
jgi:Xaa-Pro aminopeptidase